MMYGFGWLLIIAAIGIWFVGLGLGAAPFSAGLFALGVMLAALGAVVEAVKDLRETVEKEAAQTREALKGGK